MDLAACPCCLSAFVRREPPAFLTRRGVGGAPRRTGLVCLDGGTVIDPRDGSSIPGARVWIDGGRIAAVDRAGVERPSSPLAAIDARGKFVVPGFNDMHTHVLELDDPSGALALMLAEGVTGFRQMSGSPELLAARREGGLPIGDAAPAPLELPGALLTPFNASSPETVAEEIARQKRQGADFAKAGLMSAPVFRAALEAARREELPLLGHLQDGVEAAHASDTAFKSIEHLGPGATVWIGCSRAEEELMRAQGPLPLFDGPPPRIPFLERLILWRLQTILINPAAFATPAYVERMQRAFDTFEAGKCAALAERFARNRTWHVPTLVRLRTQQWADRPEYANSAYLRFMPRRKVAKWRRVTRRFTKLPVAMRDTYAQAYPRELELAKTLADAGVPMLTGCDGGGLSVPGLTLQEEFVELGRAGLSPLQVLQMTTIRPAEYLGRTDTMGSVAAGRNADLVVLDADPLERVENLSRIAGVMRAGRWHSRADLDALSERVARGRGYLDSRPSSAKSKPLPPLLGGSFG